MACEKNCLNAIQIFTLYIIDIRNPHFVFSIFENMDLEDLENDIGKLWYKCVDHSQLRWLGPEKGAVHWPLQQYLIVYGI